MVKTISNLQVLNFFNNTKSLYDKKLPVKIVFAIKYNLGVLNTQATAYESARQTLGVDDEFLVTPEMNELLNETSEMDIKTIKMEDLLALDDSSIYDSISIRELEAMDFMIEY